MNDVLVDTSVWIDFFRRAGDPQLRQSLSMLLEQERVVLVDPVIAELLTGTRGENDRRRILTLAQGARRAELTLDSWIASGDLRRTLSQQGRTLSLADCLLAAIAQRDGLLLWTLDKDLDPLLQTGKIQAFHAKIF